MSNKVENNPNIRRTCVNSLMMGHGRRGRWKGYTMHNRYIHINPNSSLATGPRIFSNLNYHARLVPLWKLTFLSNKYKWERQGCVFVVLKLQGLNLNANPGLSFAGKISHRDAKHTIYKWSLLALHLSGEQGWPHVPGAQSYTPHQKLPFLSINISLLLILLKCGDSKNYTILSFYCIFQP